VSPGYETPVYLFAEQLAPCQLMHQHPVALLWTHKFLTSMGAVMRTLHEKCFPMLHSFRWCPIWQFAGVGYGGRRSGIIFIRRQFSLTMPVKSLPCVSILGYLMAQRAPFRLGF